MDDKPDTGRPSSCWVVTDGRAGIENQALGLAEAVGRVENLTIMQKRISVRAPWRKLPRVLWGDPFGKLTPDSARLGPPFPDLWIGCGRLSVPFTMAVKSASPETFTVQLQNPRAPASAFDLIIPPEHDGIEGENIFPIVGSPNRLSLQKLEQGKALLNAQIAHLPMPRVAILIGGPNGKARINSTTADGLRQMVKEILEIGAGVMMTTSRRTPHLLMNALAPLKQHQNLFSFDPGMSENETNPYFGILAHADYLIVTEDSVNMTTEAAFTGKPLFTYNWQGPNSDPISGKFGKFHQSLMAIGVTRPFKGSLEKGTPRLLDETKRAALHVINRWRVDKFQ